MKILWLAKKQFDYSMDRATWLQIFQELMDLGHEVHFLTGFKSEKPDFGLGNVIRYISTIPIKGLTQLTFSLKSNFYVWREMIEFRPDIIVVDPLTTLSVFPVDMLAKLGFISTKIVMDIRSYLHLSDDPGSKANRFRKKLFDFFVWYCVRFFDGMTVITPQMERQMISWYGLPQGWMGLFSSGVNLTLFNPNENPSFSWQLAEGRFVIIFHGAITHFRGLELVVDAISLLVSEMPDILFVMMGQGNHVLNLKDRIRQLGLESHVHLEPAKPQKQVPLYIQKSHAGIIPYPPVDYWQTSSPIKLFEYLAMEKPIVVSDLHAFRDVVDEGFAGCIYAEDQTPEGFANAIRELRRRYDQSPDLGRNGRNIAGRYTWKAQAEVIIDYFERLMR